MVIHSARPQTAGTTQNNPLKTNGPKTQTPPRASLPRAAIFTLNISNGSGVCSKPVPKHPRRILPIHTISPTPPVQRVRQALPEVTGVALQWGSE